MDLELLRFFGMAGFFLVVVVVLRRRLGQAPGSRDGAPTRSAAPKEAVGRSEAGMPTGTAAGAVAGRTARPEVAATHHDALDRIASQAVLLRRHVPPRADSLSYWGGVPMVAPGFEWPHFTPEGGAPRALSFLLQVDCAAIPADARLGLMPDRGLLYFFLDLHWGLHWKWKVLYADVDPSSLAPAAVPEALPHAYGEREVWTWPRRDEDWPRLLPRFSVDPVAIHGPVLPSFREDDDDERFVWPGSVDVEQALEGIDGAIAESRPADGRSAGGEGGRPYASFPQDWQAVRITLGHLAGQLRRHGPLDRMAARPGGEAQAGTLRTATADGLAQWNARAGAADPAAPLGEEDRDGFRAFLASVKAVSTFAIGPAAMQALDATLAANPEARSVLDGEAMVLARERHALAVRGPGGLHVRLSERMLSAPTEVQDGAAERAREWLMLLEVAHDDSIGHHLAEGVLQFVIRPADLAARRFDRVEVQASAY